MEHLLLSDLLLPVVLFTAALAQAAGGIGFGLIAGPALVLVLGGTAGMQATIMLNLLVALFTWIACRKDVRYDHVLPMAPGLLLGISLGLGVAVLAPEWTVKITLCFVLAWICFGAKQVSNAMTSSTLRFSLLSGVMAGSIAIPGPAAAIYLSGVTNNARAARSAMMPLLFFTYAVTGLGVASIQGINEQAISVSASYAAMVVAGILPGLWLSRWLSERTLRHITQSLLVGTLCALMYTTTGDVAALL